MKQRLLIITVVITMLLISLGCVGTWNTRRIRGSGDLEKEQRRVSDFTAVKLSTIGDLIIEVGDQESLVIEAEDNLIEYFETEVRGRTLVIDTKDYVNISTRRPVRYYLTVKELNSISLTSSGDALTPDLEADRFSIMVSSSGNLDMGDLEADSVDIRVSSSGDVKIEALDAESLDVDITSSGKVFIDGGDVRDQEIHISSSGDYRARNLQSTEATVRISSSGTATLRVEEHLDAHISSSGDVYYLGDPTVDVTTTSSGNVKKLGE